MVDVNNPGSSVSSIVQSAIAANNGDATKGAAAREDVNVGAAAVKTNYSVDHAANGKNPTKATSYNYSSLGSQKSVASITSKDVKEYVKKYFVANNSTRLYSPFSKRTSTCSRIFLVANCKSPPFWFLIP